VLAPATALFLALAAPADAGQRDSITTASNPAIDGTDFYMFQSYESGRSGFTTMIANYYPGNNRLGGPLFHQFERGGVYEISIDNNGNAKEDVTFQFRPKTTLANSGDGLTIEVGSPGSQKTMPVPFANIGPLSPGNEAARNVRESYSLKIVRGDRRKKPADAIVDASTSSGTFDIPLDNVGSKTFGDYNAYADAAVHDIDIPGCETEGRVFVGQRDDPYAGADGHLFDLFNFDLDAGTPQPNPLGAQDQGVDVHQGATVQTIALEVASGCLTRAGGSSIVGGWATASLPSGRTLSAEPSLTNPSKLKGDLQQVSRMGNPLVNELMIGLEDKQLYNAGPPKSDSALADYFTHPTFPEIIEIFLGGAGVQAPNNFPRTDLVSAFLTGITSVNNTGAKPAEMLRLNTSLPTTPAASQNPLGMYNCFDSGGVLDTSNPGCDPAGYPNGRRPGDDAYDIVFRILMGYLAPAGQAPSGSLPFVDGAFASPSSFDTTFPYLNNPISGTG
jgi:hypothetical protein